MAKKEDKFLLTFEMLYKTGLRGVLYYEALRFHRIYVVEDATITCKEMTRLLRPSNLGWINYM